MVCRQYDISALMMCGWYAAGMLLLCCWYAVPMQLPTSWYTALGFLYPVANFCSTHHYTMRLAHRTLHWTSFQHPEIGHNSSWYDVDDLMLCCFLIFLLSAVVIWNWYTYGMLVIWCSRIHVLLLQSYFAVILLVCWHDAIGSFRHSPLKVITAQEILL